MCGIAGIINHKESNREALLSRLGGLVVSLRHRGPDGFGIWADSNGSAGLAHTRLAILDLTSNGSQPMSTSDGALHIVFNGEIYNFRELRAGLEADGLTFSSNSDTEVLLLLYQRDGLKMLSRLRGMFAFVIWDAKNKRCLMARDPLGIKPLYYSVVGGRLAFASELRVLQDHGLTSNELDPCALMEYLKTGSVPEPQTLILDCHSLDAGHYLIWQEGRIAKHRFFTLAQDYSITGAAEAVRTVREALLDSVEAHFVSDVPVGIFLSGGIDSTALVALATKLGKDNLDTFSVSVDDPELDEGSVAKRTAAHFGTRHHSSYVDGDRAHSAFGEFMKRVDQPSIDGFNTYLVSAAAREQGVKVVLSGLGGDEIFGGYKSFDVVPRLVRMGKLGEMIPGLGCGVGWLLEHASDTRVRRIGAFLRGDASVANAHQCFRGVFASKDARRIAAHYLNCSPDDVPEGPLVQVDLTDPRDAVSECELRFYMRNQLLKDSDVMSMAHGLELRVPMVDQSLLERIRHVHPTLRLARGKRILLDAVPEIPDWVRNQPKRGFVFPFEKWLAEQWTESFAEATSKVSLSRATWYQRWAVFMLDSWLNRRSN